VNKWNTQIMSTTSTITSCVDRFSTRIQVPIRSSKYYNYRWPNTPRPRNANIY